MAKTLDQKKEIVAKLEKALGGAASSVFVHFKGITVAQESKMRRALRAEQLGYTVAKKTLMRRALDTLGMEHKDVPLEGEVGVAYNTAADGDATAAARSIYTFGKEFGVEKLSIVGGIFQGKFLDASAMQEIATIPPMDTLRAMFAQLINSPRQRFAVVLSKVAEGKN